jgi:hypothetical protein
MLSQTLGKNNLEVASGRMQGARRCTLVWGRACGWSQEYCGSARPHFSKFPVCGDGGGAPSFPDETSDSIPQSWGGATTTQTAPSAQISAINDAPSANPGLHGEPPECETSRGNLAACGTLVTESAQ